MKKKVIIIISVLGLIALITAIILLTHNIVNSKKSKLQIIDATYACAQITEQFYEDNEYTYSFPCTKSSSVYVKFENGNKMLVIDALEAKRVTIDELIDAGLEVYKNKK